MQGNFIWNALILKLSTFAYLVNFFLCDPKGWALAAKAMFIAHL